MPLFADLLRRLTHPRPKPLPELDSRLALAALLVRIAKSDNTYRVEEISRIDRILAKTFAINPVEAARLRADAERLEHDAPDGTAFTDAIVTATDPEVRESVLAAMWQVALADGVEDPEEDGFLGRTADRMQIGAEGLMRARAAANGHTVVPRMMPRAD